MATTPGKGFISQLPVPIAGVAPTDVVPMDMGSPPVTRKVPMSSLFINLTINHQTGTTYTPTIADAYQTLILMDNAGPMTLTVPPNSAVAFPIGTNILITGYGAGVLTLAPGSGVTLNSPASLIGRAQFSPLFIEQVFANVWNVGGDLQ